MTAREQVIRSLTASIEGACERVLASGGVPGSRYYPTAQRERDAAFAAETLRVLTKAYWLSVTDEQLEALREQVDRACADVGVEVVR